MASWTCPNCFSINGSRHESCYSCHGPRPDIAHGQADAAAWPPTGPTQSRYTTEPPAFQYTGVVLRALALLIDVLVIAAVWALAFMTVGKVLNGPAVAIPLIFATCAYFVVAWAEFGSTVGMGAFRLRIVRAGDGARVGYARATARFVVFLATALLAPGFVTILPVLVDRKRRALHDHAAGSVVIRPSEGRFEYPTPAAADFRLASPGSG
jgi:uncharacterized RDD family membrane protein YckC